MPVSDSIQRRWVTLYANARCPDSRRARAIMQRNGIPFEDIDIDQDTEAAKQVEVWNRGYRSVPTIRIRLILIEPSQRLLELVFLNSMAQTENCIVYTTADSQDAHIVRSWLEAQRIAFKTVDVGQNTEEAERIKSWNDDALSLPTLDVTLRTTEPTSDQLRAALGLEPEF